MENQDKLNESRELPLKIHGYGLFNDNANYVDCGKLYYSFTKSIGSVMSITGLNPKAVYDHIEANFKDCIAAKYEQKYMNHRRNKFESRNTIYFLKSEMMIDISYDIVVLLYRMSDAAAAKDFANMLIKNYKKKVSKQSYISVLARNAAGFHLIEIENKKPKLDLDQDYPDDVAPFFQRSINFLKKPGSGLLLLTGPPGVGKTNFLSYLIHFLKKKVILIPPSVFGYLDSPDAVSFLLDCAFNSILLLEDAETVLKDRNLGNNSMSTLLALSDGLLGSCINLKIVCSYNKSEQTDEAALRPGRLAELFTFQPLNIEKSRKMLERLGVKDFTVTQPMTLAEIYNKQKNSSVYNGSNRKQLGFRNGA